MNVKHRINKEIKKDRSFWEYLNLTYDITVEVVLKQSFNKHISNDEIKIINKFYLEFYNKGLVERIPRTFVKANTIFLVASNLNDDFEYSYNYYLENFCLYNHPLNQDEQLQYALLKSILGDKNQIKKNLKPDFIFKEHFLSTLDISSAGVNLFLISVANYIVKYSILDKQNYHLVNTIKFFSLFNSNYDLFLKLSIIVKTDGFDNVIKKINLNDLSIVGLITLITI